MKLEQLQEHNNLNEWFRNTPLDGYKTKLSEIAQKVYDEWDEENIDVYAGGGICHFIAKDFVDFFQNIGYTAFSTDDMNEQHVFCVVIIEKEQVEDEEEDGKFVNVDEFYRVDIPPNVYEIGGGFSWSKIPNVEFTQNDIIIDFLGSGEDWYRNLDVEHFLY